ncbi:MAG: response regulator [Clostridiales bacterium]|jgi:two-component system response regulator YesN|nr:response regulator [Clostridiales bacterium]
MKGQVAAVYNVLIVDDEDKILNGLAQLISWDDYGLEIIGAAHDGQEAWDILARSECNILITDIRMPRMDGIALLQRIAEASMGVRAIVISGYDDFAYVKKALLLGIENYLLKPINEDELSATLLTILDKLDHETKDRQIRQYGADILMDNIILVFDWDSDRNLRSDRGNEYY